MTTLILHPTETSQWYALVNEAEASTHLILDEHTESYLVFLLMRFCQNVKLLESIMALDFLESLHTSRARQLELQREIGDKSLLFCGLFPGIAKRRHVSLNYFSEIGQTAYQNVGELQESSLSGLYYRLSSEFVNLQTILQAMRHDTPSFKQKDERMVAVSS